MIDERNIQIVTLAFCIAVLAVAAALWARKIVKLRRARAWPVQAGQVDSTQVRLQSTGDMQSKFFADVKYSYTVQGTTYPGSLRRTFMRKTSADKWVESYPSGLPLSVRYNPGNAADSVVFEDEQGGARVA